MNSKLVSPVTYQGGKGRLAHDIVKRMNVTRETTFYDLCCGSGAVSLALVEEGHSPSRIVMVDQGPWGLFWKAIGDGTFDLNTFRLFCDRVPKNLREVKLFMDQLRAAPVGEHGAYTFLLLQAAAFGGTPVAIEGNSWKRCGFRDYWLPTETSNRRHPVNPMMPMPDTIFERTVEVVQRMQGIRGVYGDATAICAIPPAVAYIDPPYVGTSGYHYALDVVKVAKGLGCPCWVSEGRALSESAHMLSAGRAKGGITGNRKKAANAEWLSYFGVQ